MKLRLYSSRLAARLSPGRRDRLFGSLDASALFEIRNATGQIRSAASVMRREADALARGGERTIGAILSDMANSVDVTADKANLDGNALLEFIKEQKDR